MIEAFAWGLLAGSSLLIGGWIALTVRIPTSVLGLVMAFGAGVLISAVSYELVLEAVETSEGRGGTAAGLFAGAIVFAAGNELLARKGAGDRKRSQRQQEGSPMAIVLGIVLDGIPESIVIGVSLIGGGGVSAAVIAAVFLSNLPEAIAATTGLMRTGWTRGRVMLLWLVVAVVTAFAAAAGFAFFDDASPQTIAFVLAFAGGAILTMLAETMMPEAYEHAGRNVGLVTTLGFAVAFAISYLG